MKALFYRGPGDIRYETVPDPVLEGGRDILVKIEASALCGSDLHIYHGVLGDAKEFTVGHEAVGRIVEIGREVQGMCLGDRVVVAASVGCGRCRFCAEGRVTLCERAESTQCYGLGRGLGGVQAEMVVVKEADCNAMVIPDGISTEQALALTDNLPTAYMGCKNADIAPGKTVVVVGLGSIGLMAIECAFMMGASRVFGIDPVPERRSFAERLGAIAFEPAVCKEQVAQAMKGLRVNSVINAAGSDDALGMAMDLVGKGGTVSMIGVNIGSKYVFPTHSTVTNSLTYRGAVCGVQAHWPELVPLLQSGRLHPEQFMTEHVPLSEGPEAYRRFNAREGGILKTVFLP